MSDAAVPTAGADAALDAYLDAAAAMTGLVLSAESRPAVRDNLCLLLALARLYADAPLAPSLDPAPVFRP